MNLGTPEEPDWKPITVGISTTETEIEEEAEDYYYMDGRGTPESEPATQKITRTFTGHRKIGDPVQDDGSGEAQMRADISFSITKTGASEKGTMTFTQNKYTWAKSEDLRKVTV